LFFNLRKHPLIVEFLIGSGDGGEGELPEHLPQPPLLESEVRPPRDTLDLRGRQFHIVRTVLELLSLLEEYRKFAAIMPVFASEVAHRVVELVKVRALQRWKLARGRVACMLGRGSLHSISLPFI
jgi:hypothetical protein